MNGMSHVETGIEPATGPVIMPHLSQLPVGRRAGPNLGIIVPQLLKGAVVPFLGAGASMFHKRTLNEEGCCPPSADELARSLADMAQFPDEPDCEQYRKDLMRVASYFELVEFDRLGLRDCLRPVFNRDYTLNKLHRTLAAVARHKPLLIVTTNYDDMIERAFQTAEPEPLPYHLVVTAIEEEVVKYQESGSDTLEIVDPQSLKISLDNASIIYKMHGSINRNRCDDEEDHYVITEDDYVSFLGSGSVLIPSMIDALFMDRRFLFLGYSLQDWNFRVMLSRALRAEPKKSWAIQQKPNAVDKRLWEKKNVDIFDMDLSEFSDELSEQIERRLPKN
jgi:hypothetical protein